MESSLGKDLKSVFRDFDERPLGTASIGQAHRATLKDGRKVVAKVRAAREHRRNLLSWGRSWRVP